MREKTKERNPIYTKKVEVLEQKTENNTKS